MIASAAGHANSAMSLSNSALVLSDLPMQMLDLNRQVASGEISVFEAHQKENQLMAAKHDSEMSEEIHKLLYEHNKKMKRDRIKINFGLSLS